MIQASVRDLKLRRRRDEVGVVMSSATQERGGVELATATPGQRGWESRLRLSRLGRGFGLIVVALGLVGVGAWLRWGPIEVEVHRAGLGGVTAEVFGSGTLTTRIATVLGPKIAGRMEEVKVDQGDRVEKGQVVARLDELELRSQVTIAEAEVETAQSSLVRLAAEQARAVAVEAQARRSYTRTEQLVNQKVVSPEEFDKATETWTVARAELARAEAAVQEGQRRLSAAGKELEYQQALLEETRIKAPFDALVVARRRDPGEVVVPGSAVLHLVSTEEVWISAWVDETEMARLAVDQPARVVFRALPEREFVGRLVRLGREVDRETREFLVDVALEELPEHWAVGQRADLWIATRKREGVVTLPRQALVERDGQIGVWLIEPDSKSKSSSFLAGAPSPWMTRLWGSAQLSWRPLDLGIRSETAVEVVEGLESGDLVAGSPTGPNSSDPRREGRRVLLP
mgnify:CR=1 FL=1